MNQRIKFTGPRGWQRTPTGVQETTGPVQDLEPASAIAADEPPEDTPAAAPPSARAEASWLSSSFDLMSGLQVSDFEDTVPSAWLDELGL